MTPKPSLEVKQMPMDEEKLVRRCLIGYTRPFIKIGPSGYVMPGAHKQFIEEIYNMEVRPDDIWIVTHPRSGTTWTQEMVWLIKNNLDYELAKSKPLHLRSPMLETTSQIPELGMDLIKANFMQLGKFHGLASAARTPSWQMIRDAPSPRFIKTHLPLSLLPPTLLSTAKVIYVARDPRDVVVSYYYFYKMVMKGFQKADLKEFWEAFRKDILPYAPIVEHANEAWLKRHDPNMLMMFYEDMIADLPSQIRRVCEFLNESYSELQIQGLARHLNFDNLKNSKTVNSLSSDDNGKKNGNQFLRNGQSGAWVKHFDEKMALQAEEYLTTRLQKAEIVYPTVPPYIYETACSYL